MPDLQRRARSRGKLDEFFGLGQRRGERLLNHRVDARLEERAGDFSVEKRWDRHRHGINPTEEIAIVGHGLRAQGLGHGACLFDPGIGHGHERHTLDPGQNSRMMPA